MTLEAIDAYVRTATDIALFSYGRPGSGKTTWALNLRQDWRNHVNLDSIRREYPNHPKKTHWEIADRATGFGCAYNKFPALFDNTHVQVAQMCRFVSQIRQSAPHVKIVLAYFDVSLETALEQNRLRSGASLVPEGIICEWRHLSFQDVVQTYPADIFIRIRGGEIVASYSEGEREETYATNDSRESCALAHR